MNFDTGMNVREKTQVWRGDVRGDTQRVENTPVCRVYGEQDGGDDGQGGTARTRGMSDLLGEVSTADGAALCTPRLPSMTGKDELNYSYRNHEVGATAPAVCTRGGC